ncbi:unnamed protein product [Arabis nemorensis]|uniref:Uncharacterized protein n=1 Tax=Arabis nemorensis TaxID=586526 RepID=A0A565BHV4_9BRAS|nr:unnamed protein product [Arabis nemorensis]
MGLQSISTGLRTVSDRGCKEAVEFLERISTFEDIGLGALRYPYAINIYKFAYLLRRYWREKEQDNLLNNPDMFETPLGSYSI